MIRATEVLVYAIGIDTQAGTSPSWGGQPSHADVSAAAGAAHADSAALSDARAARSPPPPQPPRYPPPPPGSTTSRGRIDDRVNVAALRDITDDSGGRTEIVRFARDLDPATSEHRRRVEQAGTTWATRRRRARTATGTRSASKCATAGYLVRARKRIRGVVPLSAQSQRSTPEVSSLGADCMRPRWG